MSSVSNIEQVLAQMRVMAAQAAGESDATREAGGDFSKLLKQSLEQVNTDQQHAAELKTSFETGTGDVNLAEVMVAIQKSNLSFQAMVQVRNKLLDAYKDIMNMPI
jgi:flagellar hook-basal body complex protein FliE